MSCWGFPGVIKVYLGAIEAHSRVMQAHPGLLQAYPGVVEPHPGDVEAQPGSGVVKTHLEAIDERLTLSSQSFSLETCSRGHQRALVAHPGVVEAPFAWCWINWINREPVKRSRKSLCFQNRQKFKISTVNTS